MSTFAFNQIVQLRNPTVLEPVHAGDVASRAHFTTVCHEGRKLAAVVTTPMDDPPLAHGTVARVMGCARQLLNTLFVEAADVTVVSSVDVWTAASAVDGARISEFTAASAVDRARSNASTHAPMADIAAGSSIVKQGRAIPVIGGPRSMTRNEKDLAFKSGFSDLMLLDINVSPGKRSCPIVCVRAAAKGITPSPPMVHFFGTLSKVCEDCVALDLTAIRFVDGSGEHPDCPHKGIDGIVQTARTALTAFLARIFRQTTGKPAGSEGGMEIYSMGIFYWDRRLET